jgi:hypothetical protein
LDIVIEVESFLKNVTINVSQFLLTRKLIDGTLQGRLSCDAGLLLRYLWE